MEPGGRCLFAMGFSMWKEKVARGKISISVVSARDFLSSVSWAGTTDA